MRLGYISSDRGGGRRAAGQGGRPGSRGGQKAGGSLPCAAIVGSRPRVAPSAQLPLPAAQLFTMLVRLLDPEGAANLSFRVRLSYFVNRAHRAADGKAN